MERMRPSNLLKNLPPRPLSEAGYHYSSVDQTMSDLIVDNAVYAQDDIDMSDAGPPTAPVRNGRGRATWFQED